MERMDVGKRIRELQDQRGVSTRALARIMDAHPNQVVRWRNAKTVKVSVVEDFCAAMELQLPEFFSDHDDLPLLSFSEWPDAGTDKDTYTHVSHTDERVTSIDTKDIELAEVFDFTYNFRDWSRLITSMGSAEDQKVCLQLCPRGSLFVGTSIGEGASAGFIAGCLS